MAELKFPTLEELGKQGGEWALDVFEYKGLTIRQWADKITAGEYQPVKHGHWIERVSDLISKQAVREALLKKGQATKRYKLGETWELNWFEIEDALSSIPIMETEPVKHGEWIKTDVCENQFKCSECGRTVTTNTSIVDPADFEFYCYNCGAKMDGGKNE